MPSSPITLTATYTETAFLLQKDGGPASDYDEKLIATPYAALYELAFEKNVECDISIKFLIEIAKNAVLETSRCPDIEILRAAPEPRNETLFSLVCSVPFRNGWQFVNGSWVELDAKKLKTSKFATILRIISAMGILPLSTAANLRCLRRYAKRFTKKGSAFLCSRSSKK
jgi:hypothetical protein